MAEKDGENTRIRIATARFDAAYGRTQILFFTVKESEASFDGHKMSLVSDSQLLEDIYPDLRQMLRDHAKRFIRALDIGQ